ncbi:Protein GLUTAMINE DUMPER 2, partial [Mucuna pruriens]
MRSIPIPPPSKLNPPMNTLASARGTVTVVAATTPTIQSSPWHSPIPYLFGGLATIMALISLALFMLACSYWRLTTTQHTHFENNSNINNDVVKDTDDDPQNKDPPKVHDHNILVIMAGDHKPTFLATPSCPNSSSSDKYLGNSQICHKSHKENGTSQQHTVMDV